MASLTTQHLWYRRAPWLLAMVALLVAAGSHLLLTAPSARRLADVQRRAAEAAGELAGAREALAELPRVEADVQEMRKKLESARKLPQHQDLGQFIRDVTAFGEEASLSKLTVQPGVPRTRDLVSEIPVSVSFQGDFLSAYEFLRRAEDMPRLTAMRGLSINSVDAATGTVEVQLSMALFFSDGY